MKARFQQSPLGGPVPPPTLRPLTTADAGATATAAAAPGAPARPASPRTAKS
jgi:hypothetical protein